MNEIDNNVMKSILFDLSKKHILPMFNNLNVVDIGHKNINDIVTSVDIKVEEELFSTLTKLIPRSLFVGEENFTNNPYILNNYSMNEYCWTVDPIDGTKNYVKGKDKFAVMVALTYGKKILQSWIYKPISGELCFAINGEGAFINEKKIVLNKIVSIENSKGSISTKYWDKQFINKIKKMKNKFLEVKSYGCMGFEYIDIAKKNREFAVLSKLSPWDHIPGILIIREAGGFDSYFDNGIYKYYKNKKNLVVANTSYLGKEILSLLKE